MLSDHKYNIRVLQTLWYSLKSATIDILKLDEDNLEDQNICRIGNYLAESLLTASFSGTGGFPKRCGIPKLLCVPEPLGFGEPTDDGIELPSVPELFKVSGLLEYSGLSNIGISCSCPLSASATYCGAPSS